MQSFHVYLHYYQQIWMDIPLCLISKRSGWFNYRIQQMLNASARNQFRHRKLVISSSSSDVYININAPLFINNCSYIGILTPSLSCFQHVIQYDPQLYTSILMTSNKFTYRRAYRDDRSLILSLIVSLSSFRSSTNSTWTYSIHIFHNPRGYSIE